MSFYLPNSFLIFYLWISLIFPPHTLEAQTKAINGSVENEKDISNELILSIKQYRERLLKDPFRPAYHFTIPEGSGLPFDPNGAFFKNGRYHLMYLYKQNGGTKAGFSWGHVSSKDLIHWRNHPDALIPGNGDEGVFSGGAFVNDNNVILSYWMLWGAKGIGLAKNIDKNFDRWEKFKDNPVIKSTEWGITNINDSSRKEKYIGSADPSNIWKKDDKYYLLTGNLNVLRKYGSKGKGLPANNLYENILPKDSLNYQGDRLYLFESENLSNWNYLHEFYKSDRKWTSKTEDNMCPSFLPLPLKPSGGKASSKHLLLFISHNRGCQYYVGDYKGDHFYPNNHGRMSWNDNGFFAPEALIDEQGRQIMWTWILDDRPKSLKKYSGWTGTYSLPRSLWLGSDGTLRMRPVKELESLRMNEKSISNLEINTDSEMILNDFGNELMEVELIIQPNDSKEYGLNIGVSEDGYEKTIIYYDSKDEKIKVDTRKAGMDFGRKIIEEAPLKLNENESLKLRVFIDNSIVEVFANDRQAIARRIYPKKNGTGITLFSNGGNINVKSFKAWEIMPSNPQ
mgnify:FL=1